LSESKSIPKGELPESYGADRFQKVQKQVGQGERESEGEHLQKTAFSLLLNLKRRELAGGEGSGCSEKIQEKERSIRLGGEKEKIAQKRGNSSP